MKRCEMFFCFSILFFILWCVTACASPIQTDIASVMGTLMPNSNNVTAALEKFEKTSARFEIEAYVTGGWDHNVLTSKIRGEKTANDLHFVETGRDVVRMLGIPKLEVMSLGDKGYLRGPAPIFNAPEDRWYPLEAKFKALPSRASSAWQFSPGNEPLAVIGTTTLDGLDCQIYAPDKETARRILQREYEMSETEMAEVQNVELKYSLCADGYVHHIQGITASGDPANTDLLAQVRIEVYMRDFGADIQISMSQTPAPAPTKAPIPTPKPSPYDAAVKTVCYSSGGKLILAAGPNAAAFLWDAQSGALKAKLVHASRVPSAVFSNNETRILSFDQNSARVWDAQTGNELVSVQEQALPTHQVLFSPDGSIALLATKGGILYDLHKNQVIKTLLPPQDPLYSSVASTAIFSPDGKLVLTANQDITVWDAQTGEQKQVLHAHTGWIRHIMYSQDGTKLLTEGDDAVRVWDAATLKEIVSLRGPNTANSILGVAIDADARRVATAMNDYTIAIWDAETGKHIITLQGTPQWHTNSVFFSPNGKTLLTATMKDGHIWDTTTGKKLATFTPGVRDASYSPDGTRIATAHDDGTVKIWDAVTGRHIRTVSP